MIISSFQRASRLDAHPASVTCQSNCIVVLWGSRLIFPSRSHPAPVYIIATTAQLQSPRWSRCTTHEATLSRHTDHTLLIGHSRLLQRVGLSLVSTAVTQPSICDTTAPDCGVSLLKPALPQPSLAFLLVSPPNILPTDFRLCTSSTLAIGGDPALLTERHVPSLVRVQVDDILRPRLLPRCSRWHGCWRGS